MSRSHLSKLTEQPSLWLFRDFIEGDDRSEVLDEIRRQAQVERWGHAAEIPIFAEDDDVVVIIDGTVVVHRDTTGDTIRLQRGDAFGRTTKGRVQSAAEDGPSLSHDLGAVRETTIATIARERLRDIWEGRRARRRAEIGRWFRKKEVEVPLWPLVGTMPTTRLARLMVHLVETYGEVDGQRARLPTALRASQLAQLAGLDKDAAARTWELFEKTGLVNHDSGRVVIEDLPVLRQYALG